MHLAYTLHDRAGTLASILYIRHELGILVVKWHIQTI